MTHFALIVAMLFTPALHATKLSALIDRCDRLLDPILDRVAYMKNVNTREIVVVDDMGRPNVSGQSNFRVHLRHGTELGVRVFTDQAWENLKAANLQACRARTIRGSNYNDEMRYSPAALKPGEARGREPFDKKFDGNARELRKIAWEQSRVENWKIGTNISLRRAAKLVSTATFWTPNDTVCYMRQYDVPVHAIVTSVNGQNF